METKSLDGRQIRNRIKKQLADAIAALPGKPGLAVIQVGNDKASDLYIINKEEACRDVGIFWNHIVLPEDTTPDVVFGEIHRLNQDPAINGILVQVPLPKTLAHLEEAIVSAIDPKKDVDAFHPFNVGKYVASKGDSFRKLVLPCTPYGIIRLLEEYDIPISGKHVVILGRSNLIGKPVSALFLARDATVTVCHTKTVDIKTLTKFADILIVAIGKPHSIDASYVKEGAVVVDVGINWSESGVVGDVDSKSVNGIISALTPVPGGVGPMTIAVLLENVLKAYQMQNGTP